MDFRAFLAFNAAFKQRFANLAKSYPFAFLALEAELRNSFAGDIDVVAANASRLTEHYLPVDWLLYGVQAMSGAQNKPLAYIEMPGFQNDASRIRNILQRRYGIGSFSDRPILRQRSNKILHKMCTSGRAYPAMMRRIAADGIEAAVEDAMLVADLDCAMARNYHRTLAYVRSQNIRLFLATGDSKPFSRILCRIAHALDIPYVVLAHGYISNKRLLSIAPVRADALVLWTEEQRRMIADVMPERMADLFCCGFPHRQRIEPDLTARRIVFAWEPLMRKNKRKTHNEALKTLAKRCIAEGIEPVFRPHPKDKRRGDILSSLEGMGFSIDSGDMSVSLRTARMVVSSNSTVLTEAAAAGLPAVQIAELAEFHFEGAALRSLAEFDPLAEFNNVLATPWPPFNADGFIEMVVARMKGGWSPETSDV